MGFVHGKDSYFSVGGDDLTSYIDSVALNRSVDTAESSTMGTEAKTYVTGMSNSTISIAGKWDSTASTGPDAIMNSIVAGGTAVAFEYGPEGSGSANIKYSGSAVCTAYNVSSPIGDVVAFTGEFQVSGAVTKGAFS